MFISHGKKKWKRSTLLFILAGLLAVTIGLYVQKQVNEARDEVNVLVVTRAVPELTVISTSDIELKSLPRVAVPKDVITVKEEAVGKYTAMGILPGSPLRQGYLLPTDSWAGLLLYHDQGWKLAMPISLDAADSAFIKAGDQIQLSGVIRQGNEPIRVAVSDVPVLAKQDDVILVALSPEDARQVDNIQFSGGKVKAALLPEAGRGS